ncbi:hypothetical protein TNCV_2338751 [Trichonephila clavipes]|nr:hypothetical protein TNCV_2338751 [Trichonephila clavipes]
MVTYVVVAITVQRNRNTSIGQKSFFFLKGCTSTGVRNYDQKGSNRPERGAEWNSLSPERFLAYHVSSRQLQLFVRRNGCLVHQKYFVNSLKNQSHVTFCSILQEQGDLKHAGSGNVLGAITEWCAVTIRISIHYQYVESSSFECESILQSRETDCK